MEVKYLDKVSIAPTDVFFTRNKSGRERKYKSFQHALKNACKLPDMQYISITIYNKFGTDKIPDDEPLPRMKHAKDVYGKYASYRFITLDANKTRVLMESFIMDELYFFDYDILYNEDHELFKEGDQLLSNLDGYRDRVMEYWLGILGDNKDEVPEYNRKNILNAHVRDNNSEIRLVYEHYDDDTPGFYIYPSETRIVDVSSTELKEFEFDDDILDKDFDFVESNGEKFKKGKYQGDNTLESDKTKIIFYGKGFIWSIIKIPNTDLSMSVRYVIKHENGKLILTPHHWMDKSVKKWTEE